MKLKSYYRKVAKTLKAFKVNSVLDSLERSKAYKTTRKELEDALFTQGIKAINADTVARAYQLAKVNQDIVNLYGSNIDPMDEEMIYALEVYLLYVANVSGQSALENIDDRLDFDLKDKSVVKNRVNILLSALTLTTLKFLANKTEEARSNMLTENEAVTFVMSEFKKSVASRADIIMKTETAYMSGIIEYNVYKRSGVMYLKWQTALDERVCPICSPLDNSVVSTGADFISPTNGVGGQHPPIHIGCRCYLEPQFDRISTGVWTG